MPRTCLVLLGVWLGLVLASWAIASASFRNVDRVLGPAMNPELGRKLSPLAPEERRVALRHVARVTRVSPPSAEKRSMTTLVSLTKPGKLSAEIAMLPRNECWL